MKHLQILILCFLAVLIFNSSCQKDESETLDSTFIISSNSLTFNSAKSDTTIKVRINTGSWKITSYLSWCTVTPTASEDTVTNITISVSENTSFTNERSAILLVDKTTGSTIQTDTIFVYQKSKNSYPSYRTWIAPDITGMESSAVEIASKMKAGWNLGNSLEAIGGETAWGNPKTTQALIDLIKQRGFNAIRIPCSWNQYVTDTTTAEISSNWLNRVKEVVQYCINDSLYVILNIHWDGGWLENNCTTAKQKQNNAKQKAFWEQIASTMRDFDEHLLFASANEPNVSTSAGMAVLKSYHQTFINAVRSTGGKNSYRILVIQGPSTDIETTNKLMSSLPTDSVEHRMMVEVHFYTPWNFCGLSSDESWGNMFYYWGTGYHSTTDTEHNATFGEESDVQSLFSLMRSKFVYNNIPVILGEYAAMRRLSLTGDALTLHLSSRAYYHKYVTKIARSYGLKPFYWDNGGLIDKACGIFNRNDNTVYDQLTLNAIMEGAE
jgi:endoglucanase